MSLTMKIRWSSFEDSWSKGIDKNVVLYEPCELAWLTPAWLFPELHSELWGANHHCKDRPRHKKSVWHCLCRLLCGAKPNLSEASLARGTLVMRSRAAGGNGIQHYQFYCIFLFKAAAKLSCSWFMKLTVKFPPLPAAVTASYVFHCTFLECSGQARNCESIAVSSGC